MKVYLVGGAVRDRLLGEPVHERDFVVVGATPVDLLRQGFRQVGRDFPVFLHPKTHEEYALARTERKTGTGYRGFICDYDPSVTLAEDLARRDLTINAIAQDELGNLIDPYHGMQDLKAKQLRHVSPAFVEDPVRVLRVARFAARFYHLGFRIAEETCRLISQMIASGELLHLVPERVWQEWEKSLETKNPQIFIKTLQKLGALKEIFPELVHDRLSAMLNKLARVSELSTRSHVRFAAFMSDLNDIHRIEQLIQRLRIPRAFQSLVRQAVLHSNLVDALEEGNPENMVQTLEQVDAFRKPERFLELLTVCEKRTIIQEQWKRVLQACFSVDTKHLIKQGYQGLAMKEKLHQSRVAAVRAVIYER